MKSALELAVTAKLDKNNFVERKPDQIKWLRNRSGNPFTRVCHLRWLSVSRCSFT